MGNDGTVKIFGELREAEEFAVAHTKLIRVKKKTKKKNQRANIHPTGRTGFMSSFPPQSPKSLLIVGNVGFLNNFKGL